LVVTAMIGAPAMPVEATPRRALIADSSDWMFGRYCEGMAARKAGGVEAARAELMMDWISPVTPAAEAALWTATPKGNAMDAGMYSEISWLAAEAKAAELVAWRFSSWGAARTTELRRAAVKKDFIVEESWLYKYAIGNEGWGMNR
jgi:hypothetical protein